MAKRPVSSAILRYVADQLKKGDPPWWQHTFKAWEERKSRVWSETWGLFLASLHYEALSDAKNPLARYFPSCGGTAEADPAPALTNFLASPPASFFEHLRKGELRAYHPQMATYWTGPAHLFFGERELPYYLVEINAGAGLNLVGDLTVARQFTDFDPSLVEARVGLDSQPLLMEDISQRRWLTAGVLPDNGLRIVALDRAIEALSQAKRRDLNFVQLLECPLENTPKFIVKNIPCGDLEVGLLVFNLMTTSDMLPAAYQAFSGGMLEMMRAWGTRALWVEGEVIPGEYNSRIVQQRAHFVDNGLFKTVEFGRYDFMRGKQSFNTDKARRDLIVKN